MSIGMARLDSHGWELESAVERHERSPDTFRIPSEELREGIVPARRLPLPLNEPGDVALSISTGTRRARGAVSIVLGGLALLAGCRSVPHESDGRVGLGSSDGPWPPVATFSVLGFDPATGEVGVAVQSRVFSVGSGVVWGKANVGVVATQAVVDVGYGPRALELLEDGEPPSRVVERILAEDPDPRPVRWGKAGRQFAVMDAQGNVAVHTGEEAPEWSGHEVGRYVSAQGNILVGPEVVSAMVKAFGQSQGHLSYRLLAALEAGQAAGGDRRGMQSAAMLIVKEDGGVWLNNDVVLRLQVDDHEQPIRELRRLVEIAGRQRQGR